MPTASPPKTGGTVVAEAEFLTTAQVLELLQIGRTKLWELVRSGSLPAYRIGEGATAPLRYRRSEVLDWLEGRRVAAPDAPADSPPSPE